MFIIEDGFVKVSPEALLIEPVKVLWEKDKTKRKEVALLQIAYVVFMLSPKKNNPFYGFKEEERESRIMKNLKIKKDFIQEEDVVKFYDFYKDYLRESSPTLRYYESALAAAKTVQDFLGTVDLNKKTKTGTPLYKPVDITRALKDTEEVVQNLFNLKDRVEQELSESGKTVRNRQINPFETGEE